MNGEPEPAGPTIREATAADADAIRRVHEAAFGQPDEAAIVDALAAADAVTLSMLAELTPEGPDGGAPEVVAHVLYSPVRIETPAGVVPGVGLAPMAVLPSHQRRGIGTQLVQASLDALRRAGHRVVIVLGHRAYYPRFGFVPAHRFGLRWEHPCPEDAFMVLGLVPDALPLRARTGVVRHRPELGGTH